MKTKQEIRQELMAQLTKIQNRPENLDRDIMTFAGMCNNEELAEHIKRNMA